jgi:cob(I)alamin adenosyltransferase
MKRFYTSNGDDGYTGLLGKGRVPKDDARLEAIGALDEASAALGVARTMCRMKQIGELLLAIQRDLINLMAEIAATPENAPRFRVIDAARVDWLEEQTNVLGAKVKMPNEFIIPGASIGEAALAFARTIVRRAERRVAHLLHADEIENVELLRYLNRLSSLCFVLELMENQQKEAP